MSLTKEVSSLLSEAEGAASGRAQAAIDSVVQMVSTLLTTTGVSFEALCHAIETASCRPDLKLAFQKFNTFTRFFLEVAPAPRHADLVCSALLRMGVSERLEACVRSSATVRLALTSYKTAVLLELAIALRLKDKVARRDDLQDEELFSRFLPEPISPGSSEHERADMLGIVGGGSRKRGVSAVADLEPIPRKSKVPALASIEHLSTNLSLGATPKKKLLVTREKLRAGFHDPKGLLDLVDSSTSALERTKKLELLKSAGFEFDSRDKSSFPDKLNAAILRLELGLGGHSLSDTYLFGTKVMSSPGVLSGRNITDIQTNVVDGKTTWKHQNAYCKMVIAGCLNQAKRIFEKYDEILYGPAPGILIGNVHRAIKELLESEEARMFLAKESAIGAGEDKNIFIKKIVEAVSPIIPITIRNKSLDGGYFRTAMGLLGAAEFLFAQYESDVRAQANPTGVIGMCSSMHAEFERGAIYNEELKPLRDFMREMVTQYQTSLGLGDSFANDGGTRMKKRQRKTRGRPFHYGQAYQSQGSSLGQQHTQSWTMAPQNYSAGRGFPTSLGRGQGNLDYARGRGLCFRFQTGTCNRGESCRFTHLRS